MREQSKPEGWRREAAPLTRARPAARGGTRQEFRRHLKLVQREAEFAGAKLLHLRVNALAVRRNSDVAVNHGSS